MNPGGARGEGSGACEHSDASNPHHHKICQTLNLKAILIESLGIDFNISFKGSKCTFEQKFESQKMLIDSIELSLRVLLAYVNLNPTFRKSSKSPAITALCYASTYPVPPKPADWNAGTPYPAESPNSTATIARLAKLIIIELCRGNPGTTKRLPSSTFEMFAGFINEYVGEGKDPTTCPDTEFLFVAANPTAAERIRKNQNEPNAAASNGPSTAHE